MRIGVSLAQLETFVQVANHQSFSAASRVLFVSQPALSRVIRQLEDTLHTKLFDRDTHKVILTPAGENLLPIARRILTEFDARYSDLAQFISGKRGRITLVSPPAIAASILPQVIAQFRKTRPEVHFNILGVLSSAVAAVVGEGSADIGVTIGPVRDHRLAYVPLVEDDFVLVCRTDDSLAMSPSVNWTVFSDRPFISMGENSSIREVTDSVFRDLGIVVTPFFECDHSTVAIRLISAGLGISALPRVTVLTSATPEIAVRPLIPTTTRTLGVVSCKGRTLVPAARDFLTVLIEQTSQLASHQQPPRAPNVRIVPRK